jgi:glycosyltransferase involved in cell wall biosynthesis
VGSAPYADDYTRSVHDAADDRVRFLGGVWDQQLLDQLYGNALSYLHGHSVGGTNPSLLRAIGAGAPTTAYDVSFNREVLEASGLFFTTPDDLARAVEVTESDLPATAARGRQALDRARSYDWDEVARSYADLCGALAARTLVRSPGWRRGRRTGAYPSGAPTRPSAAGPGPGPADHVGHTGS